MKVQDFEIKEIGKCPLCLGNKESPPHLPTPPPPDPKMTKTWQSCNRPVSVRYTFSTGKSKYWSAQENYHLNRHSVHACIRSQLRLLQVSAIWFYYILKISPNFKTCSNLEQATHHKPLQCHQFLLHGLAYLLSTSTTWHYIQPTHSEGLWSYTKLELHTSAVSHTFPLPYVSVEGNHKLFSSQLIPVWKVCPSGFSRNLVRKSCY